MHSGNLDNKKGLRIDRCNNELSEVEIINCIEQYGEDSSKFGEVAIPRDSCGMTDGTGPYILKVKQNRFIPNIIAMHGLKIKCSFQGVKKQCCDCYEYHMHEQEESKSNNMCEKKTLNQNIAIYMQRNP